jgi:hypothetical protein
MGICDFRGAQPNDDQKEVIFDGNDKDAKVKANFDNSNKNNEERYVDNSPRRNNDDTNHDNENDNQKQITFNCEPQQPDSNHELESIARFENEYNKKHEENKDYRENQDIHDDEITPIDPSKDPNESDDMVVAQIKEAETIKKHKAEVVTVSHALKKYPDTFTKGIGNLLKKQIVN